jgi:alkylhydroperoxidase/carboxymuconolactone decarboxylase family protein YurZ
MSEDVSSLALALAEVRGLVAAGFEKTTGSIALILQRLDQVDNRHADLAKDVEELRKRLAELDKEAVTRDQLADRTRQIIAIVGVLVTVAGAVIALIQLTRG